MAVIALAGFVVVAQHAFAGNDKRQAVLEPVRRALDRVWNTPDDDFDEGILGKDMALLGQRLRLHVGEYANTTGLLSNTPTTPANGPPPADEHPMRPGRNG